MWPLVASLLRVCASFYPRRGSLVWPFWLVVGIVLLFLGFQARIWLNRARAVPFTEDQAVAVRAVVSRVLDEFESRKGALPATASVVHLSRDPSDEATAILRDELSRREGWTLLDGSPGKIFLKRVGETLSDATSVDEAVRPGNRIGVDVVFSGKLLSVTTRDGISRAELSFVVRDSRRGEKAVSGTFAEEYPKVSTAIGRTAMRQSRRTRIVLFALLALGLPWALRGVVERVRDRKSNAASAVLLGGLLLCDALFASVLFYGIGGRPVTALIVLLALFIYNLCVCEYYANRR